MRLLHGSAEARWMPSRHHFAIFRLIGWLHLRRTHPSREYDRILSVHRYQSGLELYCVGFWTLATLACYFAGLLDMLVLPAAIVLGFVLASIALHLAAFASGLVIAPLCRALARRRGQNNLQFNSFCLMLMLVGAAFWFSAGDTWTRFAAWQFLAGVLLNAIAAAILFFARKGIARLESTLGGEASSATLFSPSR